MSISGHQIENEESVLLVCAYFNHLLRVIGINRKYNVDEVSVLNMQANLGLYHGTKGKWWAYFVDQ